MCVLKRSLWLRMENGLGKGWIWKDRWRDQTNLGARWWWLGQGAGDVKEVNTLEISGDTVDPGCWPDVGDQRGGVKVDPQVSGFMDSNGIP